MLAGRDREHRLIGSLPEAARAGASGALVIRGEPGIGKTAVLEHAALGSGLATLRCTGVESEHGLPFAGLGQLFRPVQDLAERLPHPQAAALRRAFGLSSGRVEGRLLVGLATLSLLAEATAEAVTVRDLDEAEECAREGIELTRQFAQENQETAFSAILVRCLAAHGRIEECQELGEATLRRALAHGIAVAAADVRLGLAELELSLAHGPAARDLPGAISHPLFSLIAAPYLVEATLLSGGDPERARTAIGALAGYAEQAQHPVLLGLVARSRALLAAPSHSAEPLFLEARRACEPAARARLAQPGLRRHVTGGHQIHCPAR